MLKHWGHPLALHLWSPDEEIPEEGQAVQDFVQRTVLRRLTDEGLGTLDELSLSPLPLSVEELSVADGITELDDSAVLRWMQSLVEPHHLIRNVRRATVDEKSHENYIQRQRVSGLKEKEIELEESRLIIV